MRAARKRQCLGRYGEAAALGESALRWARRAGATEGERASVLGVLGFSLLYGPEPVSSAVPRLRTLLSRYGDQGPACRLALAGPLVLLHAMQGRDSLARAALVLARSAAAEADPRCGAVLLSVLEARLESLAGRTTRSARHLAEARDAAASLGLGPVRDAVRWASVRLLTDAGRYEEAARRLAAGGSPVVRTEGRGVACSVDTAGPAGLLARLAAAEGRAEDARALADRAVGEAAASDSPLVHALARLDQAEVLRLAGRGEAARYAVCLAGEGFARKGHVPGVRDAAARHAALAPAARRR
ncbi:hypothetical protein ACGFS9_19045 [Streptomyces sp. NPDC048566]|uniref:hypothetical protein n=1 Tax=Streptomyces sp. NPDC048566 TaxID=3365569 RepID=UPI0037141B21